MADSVPITPVAVITVNDVVERLHQLGYEATQFDTQTISYLMRAVILEVFNFCNISKLPAELKYEVIDGICAEFLLGKLSLGAVPGIETIAKKITEGDVSVEFGDTPEMKLQVYLESKKLNYHNLIRFRKMVW